jgi:hypothetical protein
MRVGIRVSGAIQAAGPVRADSARSAHLSAVWGRNRALCVNGLIHGHLCVCGFGRCRRVAHRYTFICQESVRNSGYRSPEIPGLDAPSCQPRRTSGRDGPEQHGGISVISIHRFHICHIGGADQGQTFIRIAFSGYLRIELVPFDLFQPKLEKTLYMQYAHGINVNNTRLRSGNTRFRSSDWPRW